MAKRALNAPRARPLVHLVLLHPAQAAPQGPTNTHSLGEKVSCAARPSPFPSTGLEIRGVLRRRLAASQGGRELGSASSQDCQTRKREPWPLLSAEA